MMMFNKNLIHLQLLVIITSWIAGQVDSFVSHHHKVGTGTSPVVSNNPAATKKTLSTGKITTTTTTTELFMAATQRRSTGNKKNGSKKRKPNNSNKDKKKNSNNNEYAKHIKSGTPNSKKNKKRDDAAANPMSTMKKSTPNNENSNKTKRQAPPWQTISTKDMNKNVEAEKNRRLISKGTGQHLTPAEIEETQTTYERSKSFLSPQDKLLCSWKPFALNSNKQEIKFQGAYLNKQLPPRLGVPEVAFLGRSNVGKSSLLNRLVGKSDLARVGKTPGATASVNLYGIFDKVKTKGQQTSDANHSNNNKPLLGLVDLPGFGYAKLDKGTQQSIQDTAENYLAKRKELALGILLVDSRRVPTMDDKAVLASLFDMGLPLMVVATKADKFSTQDQIDKSLEVINRELGLPKGQPLCISVVSGQGIKDLWRIVLEACEGHIDEFKNNVEQGGDKNEQERQPMNKGSSTTEPEYIEDDDDDAEIRYSQGYDWIQGSVMYEGQEGDASYDDGEDDYERRSGSANEDDDNYDDDEDDDSDNASDNKNDIPQKETMKYLRKKAKEMEKRGEFY
jgi:GTP-binding protein